jgi:Superinfection immunity protein
MIESIIAAADTASDSASPTGTGIIFLLVGLFVYFMPTILAKGRNHHNASAVFIINLLLGWTLVGWAVALAWAFTTPAPAQPMPVYIQKPDGTLEAVQAPVGVAPQRKVPPQIFRL